MTSDELFDDGVANAGSVFRRGNQVIRPAGAHSPAVHSLLKHLEKVGFSGAPVAIALENATETVSYMPGSVPAPPYADWCLSDETLDKIARLQRRFHDADPDRGEQKTVTRRGDLTFRQMFEVRCRMNVVLPVAIFTERSGVA